jgi:hypothetical protein
LNIDKELQGIITKYKYLFRESNNRGCKNILGVYWLLGALRQTIFSLYLMTPYTSNAFTLAVFTFFFASVVTNKAVIMTMMN